MRFNSGFKYTKNSPKTQCVQYTYCTQYIVSVSLRFRWSRGSVLAFGTQVQGFKPGRSRKKILSTPSFAEEVKPSVPCRNFTACKRSLNGVEVVISAKLPDISRPQFHLPPLGALASLWTWRHLATRRLKTGESNGNLPLRTCSGCSCARAITVA